jgi:hypothetical protein
VVGTEINPRDDTTMAVGAVLIYDRALTAEELASVEAYLAEKYLG